MRNRLATLLRSTAGWFQKDARVPSEQSLSREELRAMLLELLSDPATAREAAPFLAQAFGVQGSNPLTVEPGNAGDIVKYVSSPDTLGPATNFVEVGGNIGIGTTNPQFLLDLVGSSIFSLGLSSSHPQGTLFQLGNTNTATKWNFAMGAGAGFPAGQFIIDEHGVGPRFVIDPGGNVGIGTTNPQFLLDLVGSSIFSLGLRSSHPQGTLFQLGNTNTATKWNIAMGAGAGFPAGQFIIDEHGVGPRFVIDPGGNVGIGTSSPLNKLHVEGGNVQIGSPDGTSSGWRTLLLGKSAPKQSTGAFGPEMITAAAKNSSDPQHRRVVLWAGREDQNEAMFLLNSTGFLEWGPGGNVFPDDDQDSSLGRNSATGEMALVTKKAFVVARPAGLGDRFRVYLGDIAPPNTNIVDINNAGLTGTVDIKSTSATVPTIRAGQSALTAPVFWGHKEGENQARLVVAADGRVSWGEGSSTPDVDLSRFSGGTPATKGLQLAGGDLYISLTGKGIILKNNTGGCARVKLNASLNGFVFEPLSSCP